MTGAEPRLTREALDAEGRPVDRGVSRGRRIAANTPVLSGPRLRSEAGRVSKPAPSTCAAEVEAIRAAWAGRHDGYAKAATPVTSAQV